MNYSFNKLLLYLINNNHEIKTIVNGTSMKPELNDGDIVTIKKSESYLPGDIVVFNYLNKGLLIHRLLKAESPYYQCKGDNAFRTEFVLQEEIIGKAIKSNKKELSPWPAWKTALSLEIGQRFKKELFSVIKTAETDLFKTYKAIVLNEEKSNMKFKKNKTMDYIQIDNTSLAIFDPSNSTTYFLDESGIDILDCITEPCNINTILKKLSLIYDDINNEMENDVECFLADMVRKGILEVE